MKEVTFNEKNKELNIFDVFCTYVNDYKIVYAKDIKNRYLQRFYKQFSEKLPDHPDETRDFFLYTFSKNLDWITVYFVCSHFECGSSDYIAKLLKICKKIERKAQTHTEIIYLSFPYEVLILGWLAVLETIHREDYKFGEKMKKEKRRSLTERMKKLVCKIFTHRWITVVETATFSKSEFFYECSRCKTKEVGRFSENGGMVVRRHSRRIEVRPKENDNFKGDGKT